MVKAVRLPAPFPLILMLGAAAAEPSLEARVQEGVERGKRFLLSTFDLNELVARQLATIERTANELQVEAVLASDLPAVTADADQIAQVLSNVIENAREAMGDRGVLTVSTERLGEDQVAVTIADSGPGIAPEALPHVFDPFFTTKPMGQGTGLGLAIARGIAKMHHGDLTAGNRPEGGAVLRLCLPLQADAESNGATIG